MSGSKRKSSGAVAGTAKKCPLLYWTAVLFKVLSCKIKNVFFIFLCLFLCIIRVKSIINLLQYNTIDYVSWVPRLTLLDLQTNWTYECAPGTRSYVGDLLYLFGKMSYIEPLILCVSTSLNHLCSHLERGHNPNCDFSLS